VLGLDQKAALMDIEESGSMENSQTRSTSDELAAARSRFERVVSTWTLSKDEASMLLGSGQGPWRNAPHCAEIEARMRLISDVDALLGLLVDDGDLPEWLRTPNDAFVDSLCPLDAMSLGLHAILGIRNVLMDISGRVR